MTMDVILCKEKILEGNYLDLLQVTMYYNTLLLNAWIDYDGIRVQSSQCHTTVFNLISVWITDTDWVFKQ